jgi:hypothetical protein
MLLAYSCDPSKTHYVEIRTCKILSIEFHAIQPEYWKALSVTSCVGGHPVIGAEEEIKAGRMISVLSLELYAMDEYSA